MISVNATDLNGVVHELQAETESVLMELLRDAGMVDAVCGGAMACGTCIVEIVEEWAGELPGPSADESLLIDAVDTGEGAPMRLSCQLCLGEHLDGLTVRVASADF